MMPCEMECSDDVCFCLADCVADVALTHCVGQEDSAKANTGTKQKAEL